MDRLRLRKVGNSVVVTLPVELLSRYGLKEGDDLKVGQRADGIMLRPDHTRHDRQLSVAEKIMDRHQKALALLAK